MLCGALILKVENWSACRKPFFFFRVLAHGIAHNLRRLTISYQSDCTAEITSVEQDTFIVAIDKKMSNQQNGGMIVGKQNRTRLCIEE